MKTTLDKLTCKILRRKNTVCPPQKNPVFSINLAFLDQFSCSLTDALINKRTLVVVELLTRLKT